MPDEERVEYDPQGARAFASYTDAFRPVAMAIADRLPVLDPGARLLDLACGPGEPGLTVLERSPSAELVGVDLSEPMLELARARAVGRARVRFFRCDMGQLDLEDGSVDAAVSRFGFLALEDVDRSAGELARVVRPGAPFSLAVWDRLQLNTVAHASIESLRGMVGDALLPPLDELDARAAAGLPAATLGQIGVDELRTELFAWRTEFDDLEPLWSMVAGPGIWQPAISTLDAGGLDEVRARYTALLAEHAGADGSYSIPTTCRLLWGRL